MLKKFLLLSSVLTVIAIVPAMAEEPAKEAPKEAAKQEVIPLSKEEKRQAKEVQSIIRQQKEDSESKKATPLARWIKAENALIDPLNDLDKESIFVMRNKYSVIRVIGVVERDIGNAVSACGKANPDMKIAIEKRFSEWQNAVNPVIETAKKQLESDIEKQTIVDKAEFKKVLKLNDEAYQYGEKQVTKTPVSSKEACEDLIESMDDTESDMIELLQETLLPESVLRQRVYKKMESDKKSFSKTKEKTEPVAPAAPAAKP